MQILPFEITEPPPGWVDFCAREPTECAVPTTSPRNLVVSAEVWSNLDRVNNWVNATVKPLTDVKHWGVVELWSIPDDGYGDCEDYVLLKRRILMQAGWPREALLVTVVLKGKNEGHTVLTVTTDKGDYVLDNLNKNILLWSATGYRFVKRQSQANPNVWVSLIDSPRSSLRTQIRSLPATMSLARLWHDQGKVREAREGRTYPASDCRRERGYGANW